MTGCPCIPSCPSPRPLRESPSTPMGQAHSKCSAPAPPRASGQHWEGGINGEGKGAGKENLFMELKSIRGVETGKGWSQRKYPRMASSSGSRRDADRSARELPRGAQPPGRPGLGSSGLRWRPAPGTVMDYSSFSPHATSWCAALIFIS